MGCVYIATNRINGKCYVGQTVNLKVRKKCHRDAVVKGSMLAFHCAIRKYGFAAFDWERLYRGKDVKTLYYWERYYIKMLKTKAPNGYNLTDGGEGSFGAVRSPATCAKIGDASRGRKLSLEWRTKIGDAQRGMKKPSPSTETREKLRAANLGKKASLETRAKMSVSHKGLKCSIETCNKIGDVHRGLACSPETRAKIGNANRGEKHTADARAKMSASRMGVKRGPMPQWVRDKISAAKRSKRNAYAR